MDFRPRLEVLSPRSAVHLASLKDTAYKVSSVMIWPVHITYIRVQNHAVFGCGVHFLNMFLNYFAVLFMVGPEKLV